MSAKALSLGHERTDIDLLPTKPAYLVWVPGEGCGLSEEQYF